jgi:tRNA modification GTPase
VVTERKNSRARADTIVAIITPPGEGGISALRLAGPRSLDLLQRFFRGQDEETDRFPPFLMRYGAFIGQDGKSLDEVLAVYMPRGRSYTGLNQVEIFCHGGRQVVRLILQTLVNAGARPAEPGEFTKLAFLSGRIDLSRAEAVAEIIAANTETSYRAGREHLLGSYSQYIEELRDKLVGLTAEIEASIDFAEEDIDPASRERLVALADELEARIKKLADSYRGGRIIGEGFRLAIGGRPNAGKSSLFNLLLREERALVNPKPGTTRDYLSEWIDIEGVAVNVIDTAGLRKGGGEIEKEGQVRAHRLMRQADLVLWMADLSRRNWRNLLAKDLKSLPQKPILIVGNKIDISKKQVDTFRRDRPDGILLSCKTGRGFGQLETALIDRIDERMPDLTSGQVVTSARHKVKLTEASKLLKRARKKIKSGESPELTAFDLRQAIGSLDEITGRVYTEEILARIFSQFCIGK